MIMRRHWTDWNDGGTVRDERYQCFCLNSYYIVMTNDCSEIGYELFFDSLTVW